MGPTLSVLIPAYNEEKVIKNTTLELKDYLESIKSRKLISSYEIIICINNSKDKTEEISKTLSKKYSTINYFTIKKKGMGLALREGIKRASKDLITFTAADGEILNGFIEKAIIALRKYDFINGSRYLIKAQIRGSNFLRMFLSVCFAFVIKFFFSTKFSEVGTTKAFKREWSKTIINKCRRDDSSLQVEILYYSLIDRLKTKEIPIYIEIKRETPHSKVRIINETWSFFKTTLRFALRLRWYQFKRFLGFKK